MKTIKSSISCTILLFLAISLSFCSSENKNTAKQLPANDTLRLEYAAGFAIFYHDQYKEVVVYSPWETGSVYARYYLTTDKNMPTPDDGTKVNIPLETIALTSVTHIEFLNLLDELHTVTAMCSPALVYNSELREKIGNNEITDLGDAFNINVEKTLMLGAQAVMTSGYNQSDPAATRISRAGIPVLFNNEWMETTLLGRAEWIKFVSAFYDKEAQADSVFFHFSI